MDESAEGRASGSSGALTLVGVGGGRLDSMAEVVVGTEVVRR